MHYMVCIMNRHCPYDLNIVSSWRTEVLHIILAYFWLILPCCGVRWWPSYAGNVFLSACSCLTPFSPPSLLLLQSPNHSRLEMTTNPSAFRWLAQNTARLVPIFSNRSFTSGSQLHVYRTGRLLSGKNQVYDFLDKFSGCSLCVFGEWKKRLFEGVFILVKSSLAVILQYYARTAKTLQCTL